MTGAMPAMSVLAYDFAGGVIAAEPVFIGGVGAVRVAARRGLTAPADTM